MAVGKFRVPTEEESALLGALGIDSKGVAVTMARKDYLLILHHKTRAEIRIDTAGCAEKFRVGKDGADGCK